jgi:predicted ester cyclase
MVELAAHYRAYIDCLNRQDWAQLASFVDHTVVHNDRQLDLSGYRAMLEQDFAAIPDLNFTIALLVAEPPHIVSRLAFDCTPSGQFLGLPVNGRKVPFTENVIYAFRDNRIVQVWSVIDKAAVESQLSRHSPRQ